MKILIIKIGAAGDVLRTTPLLRKLFGEIYWLTGDQSLALLQPLSQVGSCISFANRNRIVDIKFDLVINLEDALDCCEFLNQLKVKRIFGAHLDSNGAITYSKDSSGWFDLSCISRFGKEKADRMKLLNRKSYQELIFSGLGLNFNGEQYILPPSSETDCRGDIAVAPKAGSVWPMKNWGYYDVLIDRLRDLGVVVNILPRRESLLEHIGDIKNHRYLISGDSLPMHIALGCGTKCFTFFICTSPWEIYD
ncbi:MAG: hypothetical protein WBM07_03800, partial [Chitinivibrionales bacterium]